MEIKTITYKRIKNLGNFNSEHLELTAAVVENEDIDEAIESLKAIACERLEVLQSKPANDDNIDF